MIQKRKITASELTTKVETHKRVMPSKRHIANYWYGRFPWNENKLKELGKFTDDIDFFNCILFCFACGFYSKNLEKAHIHARYKGGKDSVENLHLLCNVCHNASEHLSSENTEEYFEWFKQRNHVHTLLNLVVVYNPTYLKTFLLEVEEFKNEKIDIYSEGYLNHLNFYLIMASNGKNHTPLDTLI